MSIKLYYDSTGSTSTPCKSASAHSNSKSRPCEPSLLPAGGINLRLVYAADTLLASLYVARFCYLLRSYRQLRSNPHCMSSRVARSHGGYITADVANQGHIHTTICAEKRDANKGRKGWSRRRATQPLPLPPLRLAAAFPSIRLGL